MFAGKLSCMALCGILVLSACDEQSGSKPPDSSGAPHAVKTASLPSIRVIDLIGGRPVSVPRFSNWTADSFSLKGTMIWNGERKIDSLTYTLRKNGVVKRRGDVDVPGGAMLKDVPVEVTLALLEEPTSDMEITIEVMY